MLFPTLDLLHDSAPRSAAMNMALDEVLLRHAVSPALRFYRWSAPAVSFGYFGKFAEATRFAGKRDLVRRWTGGGIVSHGEDLTYAIVIPAATTPSTELYRQIHAALSCALAQTGLATTLLSEASPKVSDACFANPVPADVMLNGAKIAGAAHRRTKNGLLHQGSIQLRITDPAFGISFARALSDRLIEQVVTDAMAGEAREIAERKYATDAWNHRR